jgi:hypothetical protein
LVTKNVTDMLELAGEAEVVHLKKIDEDFFE